MVEILPPLLSENYQPIELTRRKIRRAPVDPGVKACQRCSRRKIKCSNQTPCVGCIKAGVECISRASSKRTHDGEEIRQSKVTAVKHGDSYILSKSCIGQGHEPIGIFTTRYVIPDEDTVPNLEFDLEKGSWALKAPKAKCSELPAQTRNPSCAQPSWYSNISVCSLWSCNCHSPSKRSRTSVIKLPELQLQQHDSRPAPPLTSPPPSITSTSSDCSSLQSPPTPPSQENHMDADADTDGENQEPPIFDPFSFLNYDEQQHQTGDASSSHFEDAMIIDKDSSDDEVGDGDGNGAEEDDEAVEVRNMNIVQDDWLF